MKANNIFRSAAVAAAVLLLVAGCARDADFGIGPRPSNGGRESAGGYRISVGAASGSDQTRVEYDGVTYKWSTNEKMGFYVVPESGDQPVITNVPFTSVNTSPSRYTDFEGEVTEAMLSRIDAGGRYDYYSYYPYKAAAAGDGPLKVAFDIPSEITLAPDVFPKEYGIMVARTGTGANEKPFSWLDENRDQKLGKNVSFEYGHVFSYLGIYLKLNLMSHDIDRVVITCTDGSPMWGRANVDLRDGKINFTGGSNVLVVKVKDGTRFNVDKDQNKGFLWIPMNPALAGKEFKVEFRGVEYESGRRHTVEQTITGKDLNPGMKHRAGFKLPFRINFAESPNLNGTGNTSQSFSYKGYNFGGNGVHRSEDDHIRFRAYSENLFGFGDITKNNDKRATFRLPPLNTDNTDGLDVIPVQIQVWGNGGWISESTLGTYRRLHYAAVASGSTAHLDHNYPYFNPPAGNVAMNNYDYADSGSGYVGLTSATPCVALHYIGNYQPIGITNVAKIKEIRLVPAY